MAGGNVFIDPGGSAPRMEARPEIQQWEAVTDAVTRAFVDPGGALSRHLGIGADHAPYLHCLIGEDGISC